MMTEGEAKMKICPKMTYCVNESAVIQDGRAAIYYNSRCLGSDCMAWRSGIFSHQINLAPEDRTPSVGYCGAFGKHEVTA